MMKSVIVLYALTIVGAQAQGGGKGGGGKGGGGKSGGNSGIMSLLGGVFGESGVPYGPAPKGCSTYEVIVARGTFEPGPFGTIVGDPLIAMVKREMRGEDVRGYAVQYPAKMGGADLGITDVVNRITTKSKECARMKFAIVGYSQGGMVVSAAAPKIPQELRGRMVAMVLYGAGKGDGLGFGMGGKGGPGKGGPPAPAAPAAPAGGDIKQKTMANCAPGDMCGKTAQSNAAFTGHLSYSQGAWHTRTAKYLADAFHGKPKGYQLWLSPTVPYEQYTNAANQP